MPKFCDGKCTDLLPPNHAAQASNNFVLGNDRSCFLRDQNYAILALGKLLPTTKSTDVKFQADWLHIVDLATDSSLLEEGDSRRTFNRLMTRLCNFVAFVFCLENFFNISYIKGERKALQRRNQIICGYRVRLDVSKVGPCIISISCH